MYCEDKKLPLISLICEANDFSSQSELAAVKNLAELQAFGIHVRRLREARGLSQQALADHADVAKATIQRIEQAQFSVTLDILVSLKHALSISMRDFMDFLD